jgi:hypothetical protein
MPNNEDVNKRLDAEAADVEISAFPTDRIELRLFDDGDIAMTVHYYANPDDYEAKQSVNVNYLMTEQGHQQGGPLP